LTRQILLMICSGQLDDLLAYIAPFQKPDEGAGGIFKPLGDIFKISELACGDERCDLFEEGGILIIVV